MTEAHAVQPASRDNHATDHVDREVGRMKEEFGPSSSSPSAPTSTIPEALLAFLRDVSRYPDSGIAERYKRLGISVRQGQRDKQDLIDRGLIREELEFTRSAKRRVIRLYEKGQQALLEAGF